MVFFNGVPVATHGFELVRTWDTLGMRATQSNDLVLTAAFVPEECLFHAYPVGHLDAAIGLSVMSLNVPAFGAVALGTAVAGMEWVREQVCARGRRVDPEVQHAFARMEVLVETARSVLFRHGQEVATFDRATALSVEEVYARGNLAKYVACESAIEIMQHVMEIAGGAGYHRRFPVERHLRDARAGAIMPYSSPEARKLFAAVSLDTSDRPSFGLAEGADRARLVLEGW
jgi:alkylation response protein AidB-like acyl-CoA dehydrogenase